MVTAGARQPGGDLQALAQCRSMRSGSVSSPWMDEEGVERRHRRAEVAQQAGAHADDVGDRAERLDRLRSRPRRGSWGRACSASGSARRALSQSKLPPSTTTPPIEVPCPPIHLVVECIDDRRAMLERPAEDRRRGVVHDQRHAELAADRGDLGDREDLQLRVGQRLGVVGAGARVGGAARRPPGRPGRRSAPRRRLSSACWRTGSRCRRRGRWRRRCCRRPRQRFSTEKAVAAWPGAERERRRRRPPAPRRASPARRCVGFMMRV